MDARRWQPQQQFQQHTHFPLKAIEVGIQARCLYANLHTTHAVFGLVGWRNLLLTVARALTGIFCKPIEACLSSAHWTLLL